MKVDPVVTHTDAVKKICSPDLFLFAGDDRSVGKSDMFLKDCKQSFYPSRFP